MNGIHKCERILFPLTVSVCNVSGCFVFFIYHQHSHLCTQRANVIVKQHWRCNAYSNRTVALKLNEKCIVEPIRYQETLSTFFLSKPIIRSFIVTNTRLSVSFFYLSVLPFASSLNECADTQFASSHIITLNRIE